MICPYCNRGMKKGIIYRDRYKLKWIPEEKDKGVFFQAFTKGIDLEKNGNGITTYYCDEDEIFLIRSDSKTNKT